LSKRWYGSSFTRPENHHHITNRIENWLTKSRIENWLTKPFPGLKPNKQKIGFYAQMA
jgi:hypothetical protein